MPSLILIAVLQAALATAEGASPVEAATLRWEPYYSAPFLRVAVEELDGPLVSRLVVTAPSGQAIYHADGPGALESLDLLHFSFADPARDCSVVLLFWDTGGSGSCSSCGVFEVLAWNNGVSKVNSIRTDRTRPLVLDVDDDGQPEVLLSQRSGSHSAIQVYRWRSGHFELHGSVPMRRIKVLLQHFPVPRIR